VQLFLCRLYGWRSVFHPQLPALQGHYGYKTVGQSVIGNADKKSPVAFAEAVNHAVQVKISAENFILYHCKKKENL
jgi:hypothetical protein